MTTEGGSPPRRLAILALPMAEERAAAGEPEPVGELLRERLAQMLAGGRWEVPAVIEASVRSQPGFRRGDAAAREACVELDLDGEPDAVDGMIAELRALLAGLVDIVSDDRVIAGTTDEAAVATRNLAQAPPAVPTGVGGMYGALPADRRPSRVRVWRLVPRGGAGSARACVLAWPDTGLRWAEVLDAVDRATSPCAVRVALVPVALPRSALPVLRRAAIRRPDPSSDTWTAVLDDLESTPVAYRVRITIEAHRSEVASRLAAACGAGAALLQPDADTSISAGVLGEIRSGEIVSARRAAGLLPLVALGAGSSSRHRRRPAILGGYAPVVGRDEGVLLGRAASGRPYHLRVADLAQHLLVTGLTGFGKTTTVMSLLTRLWREHGVPFLVIDPEKTEYLDLLGTVPEARGVLLGRDGIQLNPLAVPDGVAPTAFSDTVCEFIDAASGLSASWPFAAAALRNAVTELYHDDNPPTVAAFYRAVLTHAAQHGGGPEQAANLRASLGQRVASLTAGAGGDAFAGGPDAGLDWARLLARPAVVSLAGFGDRAARQLAFGLLLAGLIAFRRAHPVPGLGHLAVLEEAHLLLGGGGGQDRGFGPAFAVGEATASAIATQRGYGQGFILVTQSPRQLPEVVTRLFPNRLTHRLAEEPGAGPLESVREQVGTLGRGEAFVVDAGGHPRPVWVAVDPEPARLDPGDGHRPVTPDRGGTSDAVTVATGQPERIWCTSCPRPCSGRRWLRVLAEAELAVADAARAGADLRNQAWAATRAVDAAARDAGLVAEHLTELHAGLYCVTAKALSSIHASDRRAALLALPVARQVADEIANETDRRLRNRT